MADLVDSNSIQESILRVVKHQDIQDGDIVRGLSKSYASIDVYTQIEALLVSGALYRDQNSKLRVRSR